MTLDNNIYMKLLKDIIFPIMYILGKNALVGLKQSSQMWYNRLSEYSIKEEYRNDFVCSCIFHEKLKIDFL